MKSGQTAIVFAPHPDDETLGCGGTVLRMVAAGAQVRLVFMTDGRQSHGHLMPAAELAALRRAEALAAGLALGVAANAVSFLNHPDGALAAHTSAAVAQVTQLLQSVIPAAVFVPSALEPPADHVATRAIVLTALRASGRPVMVYEYAVWFWHHWPWVGPWQPTRRLTWRVWTNTLRMALGLRLLADFGQHVAIGAVIGQKRAALTHHTTQMTRLRPGVDWPILPEIAQGDWLRCFFGEYEVFRTYWIGQPARD